MLKEICHKIFIAFWRDGAKAVLLDAPLLFESKLSFVCDRTICVISEESIQIERVMKRNPELDAISVKQRIKAQMPLADKAKSNPDFYPRMIEAFKDAYAAKNGGRSSGVAPGVASNSAAPAPTLENFKKLSEAVRNGDANARAQMMQFDISKLSAFGN
jgi:hypothetical protein